jgi:ankyrin repeat protein
LLLDRGADVDLRNALGQTAYIIAGEPGDAALVSEILEPGGTTSPQ